MITSKPVNRLPWKDRDVCLNARIAPLVEGSHPCESCLAPCCWYLLIENDRIEDREDLDVIGEDLSYRDVVAWIDDDGEYAIGLLTPCRWLNGEDCSCDLFGTNERPSICNTYDQENCFYRWHLEADASEVCRVDGPHWRAFRAALENQPEKLPVGDDLEKEALRYDWPVTLELDLPENIVSDPNDRADLLPFFAGFQSCRIVRTPESWMLLFDTFRCTSEPVGEMEVSDGVIGGFPENEVIHTSYDQLVTLAQRFGESLLTATPEAIRSALSDPS